MIESLSRRIESLLWPPAAPAGGAAGLFLFNFLRILYALTRDFLDGQLTLRAMSLVYTTLLSVVPLIAFSFSLLKGFGFHNELEPMLHGLFEPLGAEGIELADKLIAFVDNVNGGLLGGVGLALLLFTVMSMVQKVEGSFNYIWRVTQARTLTRRFSDYLSVILVGPLITVAAIGLIATVSSSAVVQTLKAIEPFGSSIVYASQFGPFLLLTFVLSFAYSFITNTRVRLSAALVGGVSAGIMWVVAGKLFAAFVVGSTKYAAIYASFAVAVIALLWVYVAWLILLVGAQISFYCQHPENLRTGRVPLTPSGREREALALGVISVVGSSFRNGEPRIAQDQLAARLDIPEEMLSSVTRDLAGSGLLVRTEEGALLPGRDLDSVTLFEIVQAVRRAGDGLPGPIPERPESVETIVAAIDTALSDSLEGRTARELVAVQPALESLSESTGDKQQ
jgi:membrane protein